MRPWPVREEAVWRWLMVAPTALFLMAFTLAPVGLLVALSVNRLAWSAGRAQWTFVGLQNFADLAGDVLLQASFWNTLFFAVIAVSIQMLLGLGLALLTSGSHRGRTVYRTIFLLPMLLPGIVIGAIWKLMYGFDYGVINQLLDLAGLDPQNWLGSRQLALGSIIVVDVWHWTPFCYLLLLAGLEALPQDVYEAARIDGAGAWGALRHITLPLLLPAITATFIFRLILAFKVFDEVYLLTGGGPGTATEVISFTIYRRFFTEDRAGYGAAMALVTCLLILVLVSGAALAGRRLRRTP